MSSKNNEVSGIFMVLACVGIVAFAIAAFVFAVLAFVSLILTILCFFAWNTPRQLGQHILEPEEARIFVLRGLAGAILVPVFAVFCSLLFGIRIEDGAWFYLFVGGYVAGSIGVEILVANQDSGHAATIDITPPQLPAAPPKSLPRHHPESEPFRYASWDDEEERGR